MAIKEVAKSRPFVHLLQVFLPAEVSRILLKIKSPIFPMVGVLGQVKDKYILPAFIFLLNVTLHGAKEDGFESTSLLAEISYLCVALKCGHHLVHGSVKNVQEPIGSNYVPLYNFYLLFPPIEFKL